PAGGRWAVLHRIAMAGQGPIDSVRTDARGRYTLRIGAVDSSALYLVSVYHEGVAYFSQPLRVHPGSVLPPDTLWIYDTTTVGPPIREDQRLVTVAAPKNDGARDALEIVTLSNPGHRTRIARDTLTPVWVGAIPAVALQFQIGSGDFSAQAAARLGDSIAVFGAVQPGGGKQVSYGYTLPAGARELTIPIDQPVGELQLLLEDTAARVTAPGLRALGVEAIEGRRFARYLADSLPPRAIVIITYGGAPFRIQQLVPFIVVLLALALAGGFWFAVKRGPPAATRV
ncbi:MAG TPA: hypothetical protein VI160_07590, partial [Gemmatimonadales bacterium]